MKQKVTKQEEELVWGDTDEENLLKDTKGRRNRRRLKCQNNNDEDEGKWKYILIKQIFTMIKIINI